MSLDRAFDQTLRLPPALSHAGVSPSVKHAPNLIDVECADTIRDLFRRVAFSQRTDCAHLIDRQPAVATANLCDCPSIIFPLLGDPGSRQPLARIGSQPLRHHSISFVGQGDKAKETMTTNTYDHATLAVMVPQLTADLEAARADAALFERLSGAAAQIAPLAAKLEQAQADLEATRVSDAEAERQALLDTFSDIEVVSEGDDNLLRRGYKITVTRKQFDGYENTLTSRTYRGFKSLPFEVFVYLIERRPELIPTDILEFAPNNAWDAFDGYFIALQRGYISRAAA